jgi:chromosome segregation ATPase
VEDVVAAGETVKSFATEKGEACQGALSTLIQAASDLNQQLPPLVNPRTVTALEGVETAAGQVSERAKALWDQARGRTENVEAQRARLEAELEANRQVARTGFEHVRQTVQALGAAVAQQAAAAQAAIATLRQEVTDARTALTEAKGRFLQALEDAEDAVEVEVDLHQDAIHSLRNLQTEGLVGLANTMVDAHNITVVDLRQRLVDELPAELWRAVGALEEALDKLKTVRDEAEAPLDTKTTEVQKAVKDAQEALMKVREFAEQAKQVD